MLTRRHYVLILILMFPSAIVQAQTGNEQYDYTDVQPIIAKYCNLCHSNGEVGFKSNTYEGLLNSRSPADRYDGPYVIPFNAAASPLIDKISSDDPRVGDRMPLNEEPVSDEEIQIIRDWINQGAVRSLATSTEEDQNVPEQFRLVGNYPNPFNPSTTIRYESLVNAEYRLNIYNVAGVLLQSIDGITSQGIGEINIRLDDQPSGVYFYRLVFLGNSGTRSSADGKMTLVQ